MRPRAALLLALLAAAACASTGDPRDLRGRGTTRFYGAPFEAVWEAALEAVEANGLRLDAENDAAGYIVATHPPERPSMAPEESVAVSAERGERIAIFVDSAGPGVWAVEVVNRRRFALDPDVTDWTGDVFWVIEDRLGEEARLDAPGPAGPGRAAPDSAGSRRP